MIAPTKAELEAAHCWDASDVLARRPEMTAFRQRTRLHHSRWREVHGHPIGTEPISPRGGVDAYPVGTRIPLSYGRETGASFVTPGALQAARARTSHVERHQSFDHQRLWADLLSSAALAFNLFGDLAIDLRKADRTVHDWLPEARGRVSGVRFAYSPGRLDPEWLNSLRAFDAAFVLDHRDGTHGIVAVDVKYHEKLRLEQPKPENLWLTGRVHARSGAFHPRAFDLVKGRSDLWEPWLEHLLMFSMLQHPSAEWTWGRYIVVYPSDNADMGDQVIRYRKLLADPTTFSSMTIDRLLSSGTLPRRTVRSVRDRYLPG